MLGSTLLFSFVTDRQQKYMLAAMPIIFVPFVLNFSTGVMIYWITSNFWTIGQQGTIKRTMGHRFPQAAAKGGAGTGGSKGGDKGGKGAGGSKGGAGGDKGSKGGSGGDKGGGKPAGEPSSAPRPQRGGGRRPSQQAGRRSSQRRGGRKR